MLGAYFAFSFPPKEEVFLSIVLHCAWGEVGLSQAKCNKLSYPLQCLLFLGLWCAEALSGFWNSLEGNLVYILLISQYFTIPSYIFNRNFCCYLETSLFLD